MGNSGHNTSIAPSKLGPIRMPSDKDPAVWVPGPVIEYRLSPEEIAEKYGPPGQNNCRQRAFRLTQERLAELLKTKTVGQVAVWHQTTQAVVLELVKKYGLQLDEKNRLADADLEDPVNDEPVIVNEEPIIVNGEPAIVQAESGSHQKHEEGVAEMSAVNMTEQARRDWPRDKFAKILEEKKTLSAAAKAMGIPLWLASNLNKEYGIRPIKPMPRKKKMERMGEETKPQESPAPQVLLPVKCECCAELKQVQESVNNLMAWVDKHAAGGENSARYDAEAKLLSIMGSITQVGVDKFDPERDLTSEDYRYYKALEILVLYIMKPDLDALDEINDDMAERIGKLEEHARHHAHQVQNGLWSGKAAV